MRRSLKKRAPVYSHCGNQSWFRRDNHSASDSRVAQATVVHKTEGMDDTKLRHPLDVLIPCLLTLNDN